MERKGGAAMEEQNRMQGNETMQQSQNTVPPQVLPMQQTEYGVLPMEQPGYGMPVPPYVYMGEPEKVSEGLAVASMVLGIISIIFCALFYVAIPCAIVGLVLGCVYRSKGGKNGMSVAGIACSGSGLALALLILFLLIVDIWRYR